MAVLERSWYEVSGPRRAIIVFLELFFVCWLVMLLWVQLKDYWDGTWKEWPEQVPVFALTAVAYALDKCVLFAREGIVQGVDRSQYNFSLQSSCFSILVSGRKVSAINWFGVRKLASIVVLALHLVFTGIWLVRWLGQSEEERASKYGPNGDGTNDWGADIAMSKTFGNLLTVIFGLLLLPPRLAFIGGTTKVAPRVGSSKTVFRSSSPSTYTSRSSSLSVRTSRSNS